jgi:nicotinamidase/pyrazinamidase
MSEEKIHLFIIDPQIDFCDPDTGSLYVPNAEKDMQNIANMIDSPFGEKINQIHISLDLHHRISIFHPLMWIDKNRKPPNPFTIITANDIREGIWTPIYPNLKQRFIDYCEKLAENNRYNLCIWPEHCIISEPGSNVFPVLAENLKKWEQKKKTNINFIEKGKNQFTENYSAIRSEVIDIQDTTTWTNYSLLHSLGEADKIIFSGEAGSHCWKTTLEDILSEKTNNISWIEKFIILEDGTSPVSGFEAEQKEFINNMSSKGI